MMLGTVVYFLYVCALRIVVIVNARNVVMVNGYRCLNLWLVGSVMTSIAFDIKNCDDMMGRLCLM